MSGGFRSWLPPLAACIVLVAGVMVTLALRVAAGPVVAPAYADLPSAEHPIREAPAKVAAAHRPEEPVAVGVELPAVALVVTGLGLAAEPTRTALALPAPVALAFSPYGRALDSVIADALAAGHEVYVELPVEPADAATADAGPVALRTLADGAANAARVREMVAGHAGLAGAAAEAGGFAAAPDRFTAAAEVLAGRGLVLLQLGGAELAVSAEATSLPFAAADGPLDAELDPLAIDRALEALEERARTTGFAIGFVRPYPLSLERIARWAAGLPASGLNLVAPGRRLRPHEAEVSEG
jgi:polysaccharide deacetylase 2 family uncharacterized protein YibQ